MATAQTIINRAARMLGVLESGGTLDGTTNADFFEALNAMLDSWRNDSLMVYAVTNVTKTLTPGDGQYSIGSGADINTTRPMKVVGAYVTDSNFDYQAEIITEQEYREITDKTTQSDYPSKVYYDPQVANGQIYLWPVPNSAHTLTLTVWTPLTTFAATSTAVTLPPGYERALASNLAVEMEPEYSTGAMSPTVARIAVQSKKAIKRMNTKKVIMKTGLMTRESINILADGQ